MSKPIDPIGLDKWKKQNSYFHRSICPAYSEYSGMDEKECKDDLLIRFACVIENSNDFEVERISGMSNARLAKFIEDCQHFLTSHGVYINERNYGKTKTIKI